MKLKSLKKDWTNSWLQTAVSVIALVFILLVSFGVLTTEQAGQVQPLVVEVITKISEVLGVIMAAVSIFVKPNA